MRKGMFVRAMCAFCAAVFALIAVAGCEAPPRERVATDVWYERDVQVVEVILDDHVIHMPETLRVGETRFLVRNVGNAPHSMGIRGEGIDLRLDPPLQPRDEREWHVDLQPGEYEVWCPVGMHAELGMTRNLDCCPVKAGLGARTQTPCPT